MTLKEEIRAWQQSILNESCKECKNTCCNKQKHRILGGPSSVALFQEKGIPIVKRSQVDTLSLKRSVLRFRNGCEIEKPSLVEIPGRYSLGEDWYVYSDSCPFYKKNRCQVHEDERRPGSCRDYPLVFLGYIEPSGKLLDVMIMESCESFNTEKVREGLTTNFPVRIVG